MRVGKNELNILKENIPSAPLLFLLPSIFLISIVQNTRTEEKKNLINNLGFLVEY